MGAKASCPASDNHVPNLFSVMPASDDLTESCGILTVMKSNFS